MMLMRDIAGLMKPYRMKFVVASVLRTISDLSRLYPAYAFAEIISVLTKNSADPELQSTLWWLLGLSGVAYLSHILCREYAKYIGFQVSQRIGLDGEVRTLGHLFRLDLTWHERENSGNKLKRMQKGGDSLDQILRIFLTNLIEVFVNFVGITVIVAFFDTKISVLLFIFVAVYYMIASVILTHAARAERIVNIGEENFHGLAFEAVGNIRSVKVLGMSVPLLTRIQEQADSLFQSIRTRIVWYRIRDVVLVIYGRTFFLLSVAFVAWGIHLGHYELGFLVLYSQYFRQLWENAEELSRVTQDFVVAKYGISRMMEILHEPIDDGETGKQEQEEHWTSIDIRNLTFSYLAGKPVLRNLSFSVRRGEKIGIVGVSGAGKSTLFKLLLKEYENFGGEIEIGSVPLREISRSSFSRHSAVVLQDTEVFNFTLRDNITIANAGEEKNETLLRQAIEIAHVSDFIQKLPMGLETFIGEKGIKLSGGEKQRVGIARAVFKRPQILFLDEATSHLDMESEENIQDSLHRFFQSVTAIVIAHRLSTIKEMDRILVLEHGTIIESGSFDELYAKRGRFFELWEKQKF